MDLDDDIEPGSEGGGGFVLMLATIIIGGFFYYLFRGRYGSSIVVVSLSHRGTGAEDFLSFHLSASVFALNVFKFPSRYIKRSGQYRIPHGKLRFFNGRFH